MEKDGWTYKTMHANKDKTWTITFYRYDKSNTNFKGIKCEGDKIPDGVHTTYCYVKGKEVKVVCVYKDNYMIRKFVDGKEKDLEHGEY